MINHILVTRRKHCNESISMRLAFASVALFIIAALLRHEVPTKHYLHLHEMHHEHPHH